jgi:hypothetical protein
VTDGECNGLLFPVEHVCKSQRAYRPAVIALLGLALLMPGVVPAVAGAATSRATWKPAKTKAGPAEAVRARVPATGWQTDRATNVTHNSATLNGRGNCSLDVHGKWWWEVRLQDGQSTFQRVSPKLDFDCPPDQDPNSAGYQSAINDVPLSFDATRLQPNKAYDFRLAADLGPEDGQGLVYADKDGDIYTPDSQDNGLWDQFRTPKAPDVPPPAPPAPAGWELVYSDEFNGTDLNSNWEKYGATEDWPGHGGNGLRVGRAVTVHDGYADITAKEVDNVIESGAFTMNNPAYRLTYGRYEATLKTEDDPSGTTSGVALLWNVDESAHPWCQGESDFYETRTSRDDFHTFLHWEPAGDVNCSDATTQDHCRHPIDPKQWHNVALEWERNRYAIYVDGTLRCAITNPAHIPDWRQRLTFQLDASDRNMGSTVTHMKIARAAIYRREPTAARP